MILLKETDWLDSNDVGGFYAADGVAVIRIKGNARNLKGRKEHEKLIFLTDRWWVLFTLVAKPL